MRVSIFKMFYKEACSVDINTLRSVLDSSLVEDIYERRPNIYQLVVPIFHEDGDVVDVYLENSPLGNGDIRICDFGLTLMRLSYTFEISTSTRQQILDSILFNNGVQNDNGIFYLDTPINQLRKNVLQFAGCVQKICNMRYWSRDAIRSTFYEDLELYVTTELEKFFPTPYISPLEDYPVISVDWTLTIHNRSLYIYGVIGNDKAKNVAISLLEFHKRRLQFISMIVHEDLESLGSKEIIYLTKNADLQYPTLEDFKEKSNQDIERLVPA